MVNPPGNYQTETCAWCSGSGKMLDSSSEKLCAICEGQGCVAILQPSKPCPQCHGTGTPTGQRDINNPNDHCSTCGSTGWSYRWIKH